MYDYLFRFDTKEDAQAALPDWYSIDLDGNTQWGAPYPYTGIIETQVEGSTKYHLLLMFPEVNENAFLNPACVFEALRPEGEGVTLANAIIRGDRTVTGISPLPAGGVYL